MGWLLGLVSRQSSCDILVQRERRSEQSAFAEVECLISRSQNAPDDCDAGGISPDSWDIYSRVNGLPLGPEQLAASFTCIS